MIERINDYVARHFGGVGTSRGSLIRIHVWAVLFLFVISLVLPSHNPDVASLAINRQIHDPHVTSLALGVNDQRAFASPAADDHEFRIAWITGSEGEVITPHQTGFVAQSVQRDLPEIGGRKVAIDLYYLPAMRLGDSYIALLDAIKTKPDMIVLSLNPVWVLDPLATHEWQQLDAEGARLSLTRPPTWPLAASFFSPSDLAFGLADDAFEPFRDRTYYSQKYNDAVGKLDLLKKPPASAAPVKPSLYDLLPGMEPLDFWFVYGRHDKLAIGATRWAEWLAAENDGTNALNKTILRAIATQLRRSHIPSYVFLAQINSRWLATSKSVQTQMAGIERQLEGMRGAFAAKTISYQPRAIDRFVSGLRFSFLDNDPVHLNATGTMTPYLTDQLCRLASQVGETSSCPAPAKGG